MRYLLATICVLFFCNTSLAQELIVVSDDEESQVLIGLREVYKKEFRVITGMSPSGLSNLLRDIRPEAILTIGPDSLASASQTDRIPVVYCMVINTEPYETRTNFTGVSLNIPPEEQFRSFRRHFNFRRIGTVYSHRSTNIVEKALATSLPSELIARKIDRPQDSAPTMKAMFENGKIDVFWMVPDIGVYYPALTRHLLLWSFQNRIPVLSFNEVFREYGALASLEFDPRDIGRQAGEMVLRTLKGEKVSPQVARYQVRTNEVVAQKMGIPLSIKNVAEAKQ